MEMSLYEILCELKTLRKRLAASSNVTPVRLVRKSDKVIDGYSVEDYSNKVLLASVNSVRDLLERYINLRSKLALCNGGITNVNDASITATIDGKKYTVAQMIMMKSDIIEFKMPLVSNLSSNYSRILQSTEQRNEKLRVQIEDKWSKLAKDTMTQESLANQIESEYEKTKFVLLDPAKIANVIEKMNSEIDSFLTQVDIKITETNVITKTNISA